MDLVTLVSPAGGSLSFSTSSFRRLEGSVGARQSVWATSSAELRGAATRIRRDETCPAHEISSVLGLVPIFTRVATDYYRRVQLHAFATIGLHRFVARQKEPTERTHPQDRRNEAGGEPGVWLRVRILNSPVFSFSTTVCAIRDSLREAVHLCSASLRIIGSNSVSKTSCSRVSSALRSGGSHQRQHQNPSSKGSWLQKPLLPVAQGPTHGGHQDRIHRSSESSLKCGSLRILVQSRLFIRGLVS